MALIDKRFVHFKTRAAFNTALAANEIKEDSVVFIKDEKRVWTHGQFFTPQSFSEIHVGDKKIVAEDIYSAVEFLAGSGLVVEAQDGGKITYSHDNTSDVANITAVDGKFINAITFDEFGHVVSVSTGSVEQNTYTNIVAGSADAIEGTSAALTNGNVHINLTEQEAFGNETVASSIKIQGKDNIEVTATAGGVIEVGHVGPNNTVDTLTAAGGAESVNDSIQVVSSVTRDSFGHLTAIGSMPVPTKAYVDKKMNEMAKALDTSMILRGVVALSEKNGMVKLPTSSSVGDIYKVGEAGTYAGQLCQVGDMIICVKTDVDAEGKELGTNPEWVVIQANTDIANEDVIGLVKGGFETDEAARNFAVTIAADGTMYVNVPFEYTNKSESIVTDGAAKTAGTGAVIGNGDVRINHLETSKNAAGVETTVAKSSINIKGTDATKVTADATGAIIVDSHDTKYSVSVTESAASKVITFVSDKDGTPSTETFTIDTWYEGN